MRVRPSVHVLAWVLVAAFAGAAEEEAWTRAEANQDQAWRVARGDLAAGLPWRPRETAWTAGIVADDGYGRTAELLVSMREGAPASVAYLRTPAGNVVSQLHELREASAALSVVEAAGRLQVRRGTIATAGCRPLESAVERLPKVQLRPLAENRLTLHPVTYDVTLSPSLRSDRHLVVEAGEDDLAKWCEEIVAAVVACEGPPAAE